MKVAETADFQKVLSLDSLDRVDLIVPLEEEFSIEIPDEKADKLAVLMLQSTYPLEPTTKLRANPDFSIINATLRLELCGSLLSLIDKTPPWWILHEDITGLKDIKGHVG
ncbi:hypothetical protein Fmac_013731 [Flemingia macrophylla]|uniref:Carrier domain-containing protein n=1 Tax=Flemingia macrophylla TaxID=520843 RepID=A0ABD1MTY5_9FABA